jgi:GTP-binding protein
MSSYQEHISLQPSICLQPDDPKVHLATRDDKPSLALSDKFFYGGCKFLYSAERMFHHQNNDTIPEVILLGTSNVGKSTFINGLIGATQQAGARTSKKAGHTKLLNAFGVGGPSRLLHHPMFDTASEVAPATAAEQKPVSSPGPPRYGLILVDSPGYGFRSRASWGDTIVRYIQMRRALCGAVVLLSAKKPMQDADRWVLSELAKAGRRTMIVITKADSIGKDWEAKCGELAAKIRGEMRSLDASWAQNDGWLPDIYVTAAGMPKPGGIGYGAGLSGVRRAILEMVGYNLEAATTKTKPEDVQYDGDVVPFDEIKYKT